MKEEILRVGVLGAGAAGTRHAVHLAAHPRVRLVAVADHDRECAAALANRHGAQSYPDLEQMLAGAGLDALVNCSYTEDHADTTVHAFAAGCRGVLVERPPALRVGEAERMVAAAGDRVLLTSLPLRHMQHPAVVQVADELGPKTFAWATWVVPGDSPGRHRQSERGDEGAFARYVTNGLDLAWSLCGCPEPLYVIGRTADFVRRSLGTGAHGEDHAVGMVTFAGGLTLVDQSAWGAATGGRAMQEVALYGEHGRMQIPLVGDGVDPATCVPEVYRVRHGMGCVERLEHPLPGTLDRGHEIQVDHLVRCMLDGAPPLVTKQELIWLVRMIAGFYDSAANGTQIAL